MPLSGWRKINLKFEISWPPNWTNPPKKACKIACANFDASICKQQISLEMEVVTFWLRYFFTPFFACFHDQIRQKRCERFRSEYGHNHPPLSGDSSPVAGWGLEYHSMNRPEQWHNTAKALVSKLGMEGGTLWFQDIGLYLFSYGHPKHHSLDVSPFRK